jgi:Tfp pilus assembly protein PilO
MLRTNLSTRPFYNERAVMLAIWAVTALVAAVTAFNLWQVYALSGRDARVKASIAKSEVRARDLRGQAAAIRRGIDPRELASIASAAREANSVIGRRMFSWTELFNRFEDTLPPSVRIGAVRPKVESDGSVTMTLVVVARDVEGVNTFIENLEKVPGRAVARGVRRRGRAPEGHARRALRARGRAARAPRGPRGPRGRGGGKGRAMRAGLFRRIAAEKRALVVPLAAALLVNGAIYVFVVHPLASRVADAEAREAAAARALKAAERDHAAAQATMTGQARTAADLKRFYGQVLPADLAGARRATYVRLADMARDANLQYQRRLEEPKDPKQNRDASEDARLTKFEITMVLRGEYESVRQFIHDIETAPEFIVIDNISLTQGTEPGSPLVLTLDLSTYYRTADREP